MWVTRGRARRQKSNKANLHILKLYKKWVFKACEARKAQFTIIKWAFEGKRNEENTFLGNFI